MFGIVNWRSSGLTSVVWLYFSVVSLIHMHGQLQLGCPTPLEWLRPPPLEKVGPPWRKILDRPLICMKNWNFTIKEVYNIRLEDIVLIVYILQRLFAFWWNNEKHTLRNKKQTMIQCSLLYWQLWTKPPPNNEPHLASLSTTTPSIQSEL